jgi:hypothetical protein
LIYLGENARFRLSHLPTVRSGCNTVVVLSDAQIDAGRKIILFGVAPNSNPIHIWGCAMEEERHFARPSPSTQVVGCSKKLAPQPPAIHQTGDWVYKRLGGAGGVIMLASLFAALLAILGLMCFTGPNGIIGARRRYSIEITARCVHATLLRVVKFAKTV